jgi:tRNA A-37 threonylcarbamoyl transferase component Bud32
LNLDRIITVRKNKTIYRDVDRCYKVFNEDYPKVAVLNEALNCARMEESELNVPKMLEVTLIDNKWTIVYEYVNGKTLSKLIKEDPSKTDEYLNMFVDLQKYMHSLSMPRLVSLKDKMTNKICKTELQATVRFDFHMRLEEMSKENRVCHGDYDLSNVILADNGKLYVIDWAHAAQGTPLADVAMTFIKLWLEGDEDIAESYLTLYCEKSGTDKRDAHKWMPIVAAAKLSDGNSAEREMLKNWVNVVDFQ